MIPLASKLLWRASTKFRYVCGILHASMTNVLFLLFDQADVYDASRKKLLRGREDMLALLAAQLKFQAQQGAWSRSRPIWVDVRL